MMPYFSHGRGFSQAGCNTPSLRMKHYCRHPGCNTSFDTERELLDHAIGVHIGAFFDCHNCAPSITHWCSGDQYVDHLRHAHPDVVIPDQKSVQPTMSDSQRKEFMRYWSDYARSMPNFNGPDLQMTSPPKTSYDQQQLPEDLSAIQLSDVGCSGTASKQSFGLGGIGRGMYASGGTATATAIASPGFVELANWANIARENGQPAPGHGSSRQYGVAVGQCSSSRPVYIAANESTEKRGPTGSVEASGSSDAVLGANLSQKRCVTNSEASARSDAVPGPPLGPDNGRFQKGRVQALYPGFCGVHLVPIRDCSLCIDNHPLLAEAALDEPELVQDVMDVVNYHVPPPVYPRYSTARMRRRINRQYDREVIYQDNQRTQAASRAVYYHRGGRDPWIGQHGEPIPPGFEIRSVDDIDIRDNVTGYHSGKANDAKSFVNSGIDISKMNGMWRFNSNGNERNGVNNNGNHNKPHGQSPINDYHPHANSRQRRHEQRSVDRSVKHQKCAPFVDGFHPKHD